jgi:hypothetical protein
MSAENEVRTLLRDHNATLVRNRVHDVYRFPDGHSFTLPRSPSDHHWDRNALADLKQFLGIARQLRTHPQRKRKPGVSGQPKMCTEPIPLVVHWKAQLAAAMRCLQRSHKGGRGHDRHIALPR